ncbi:MAG: M28 family peptidase [Gemmatimonadota bacterium]|nr:M28 family peptidase [Gemmatimonadota bacterium]
MDVRSLGLTDSDLEALGYRVDRREGTGSAAAPPGPPPTAVRGNGAGRAWFWTLAILVTAGWFALPAQRMPDPVPANQPDTVFSSARAMSQLVEIARAPRPTGSPEHARVNAYLSDRLRALGLEVETQTETVVRVDAGSATGAVVRNVLARRAGTGSTGAVVLTAHSDGVPLSRAAGDDGIGVSAILETVRALQALDPLRNDLVVVITDGAELGSLGAMALDRHPWRADMSLVLSVDPRGVAGPALLVEGMEGNGAVVRAAAQALPRPASSSVLRALTTLAEEEGDLATFRAAGVPALGLTSYGGRASYHSASDRPINVREATLQHHGSQLLALTRAFGDADLSGGLDTDGDPRAYISLPLVGMVDIPTSWSALVTVVLVAGFLMVAVLFRLGGGSPRRALAGVGLGLASVVASTGAGWALVQALGRLHPEVGRVDSAVYREATHSLALLALVVAVTAICYSIARLGYDRRELTVGALLVPLAATVWLTVASPYAAAVAQLGLAVSLVAALPLVLAPRRHASSRWIWVGVVLTSALTLLIVVPGIDIAASVLTLRYAPLIGAALGVGMLLILPTMEWLARPSPWWTPALATAVAVATVVLSLPTVQGDAQHPVPTSLVLLVDDTLGSQSVARTAALFADVTDGGAPLRLSESVRVDSGGAIRSQPAPRSLRGRWLTVPGVGEEWARSWVVGSEGAGEDPGALLLPEGAPWVVAGEGANAFVPPPVIEVTHDVAEAGRRHLRLKIRPGLDAEMVGLRLAGGTDANFTAVGGIDLGGASVGTATDGSAVRTLRFWGRSDDGVLDVELSTAADGAPLAFDVIEHQLRPADVLGEDFFVREDSVVPDASTGSDRLIQRVRVYIPPT